MIQGRQEKTKNMLEVMFDYVIGQAIASGYLRGNEEDLYAYEVQTPEISDKDVTKLSTMLSQVAVSLVAAENQGWISKEEAAKAYSYFLGFVGYEYTPEEIPEGDPRKSGDAAADYKGVDALVERVLAKIKTDSEKVSGEK